MDEKALLIYLDKKVCKKNTKQLYQKRAAGKKMSFISEIRVAEG